MPYDQRRFCPGFALPFGVFNALATVDASELLGPPTPPALPLVTTRFGETGLESSLEDSTIALGAVCIFGMVFVFAACVASIQMVKSATPSVDKTANATSTCANSDMSLPSPVYAPDSEESPTPAVCGSSDSQTTSCKVKDGTGSAVSPNGPAPKDNLNAAELDRVFLSVERSFSGQAARSELREALEIIEGISNELLTELMDACESTADGQVTREAFHRAREHVVASSSALSTPTVSEVPAQSNRAHCAGTVESPRAVLQRMMSPRHAMSRATPISPPIRLGSAPPVNTLGSQSETRVTAEGIDAAVRA
mmetsp:Transcript_18195/g.46587  ORF Transcript_18195/g.46587 Transcript_18195/m.46587 type:complete len:310 (-) Transcript_18195:194-1123(-)|eukprot:CAMPEP_0115858506 /NCGR_PEP_ID=MMETSP0287-20121206/16134_1 /TAXON_ID=412157 /ORGANISM="Chrysochromulina rotalis, Strain UIO044" /LENGTH=309 /DNA_ID=CAMNT_0003312775 /DNA_START=5 /DNA_END=934 /DNA_ORIENTATION=-